MRKLTLFFAAALLLPGINAFAQGPQVKIANGTLEGTIDSTGIHSFKGIPYAQPPVGNLRWKEPQPAKNWDGVRKADHFGANAMQKNVFGDMNFRSSGMSEDCLYLNVWTPAKSSKEKLPVLVYFYGGGFVAGDGSESRYDGESLAQRGVVTVTINYRLGVFAFFAHPELTSESPHHASGNYGLLDQNAAIVWVKNNIAAFGGDPNHITIAGESAGSFSVCAQMLSPLSRNLIAGAIGESGGFSKVGSLADGEKSGVAFANKIGAKSLADLRALTAEQLLDSASKPNYGHFGEVIDGYFFPKQPREILEAGEQAHVPLLAGWNSAEVPYQVIMWGDAPTPENYAKKIKALYPDNADEILKLYPGSTQEEVIKSATQLGCARFITLGTWEWEELSAKTGGKPVYSYIFSRPRPAMVASMGNAKAGLAGGVVKGGANDAPSKMPPPYVGAVHSAEIEYALGNLKGNKVYAWTPDDFKVSATMEAYFANFIKTGNPNGKGLPEWPANKNSITNYININVTTAAQPADDRPRFLLLEQIATKK
jgi:para-nitrobenzyl esterase